MLEAISKRRSIRFFKDEVVPDNQITEIIKAGFYAPSGHANRKWHVVAVKDKEILEKLSNIHKYTKFMKKASFAVVVCVEQSDVDTFWLEDGSAFMENMLLQAADMDIGSCWIGIQGVFNDGIDATATIRELFSIPDNIYILGMSAFGYPARYPSNEWDMSMMPERIHIDEW